MTETPTTQGKNETKETHPAESSAIDLLLADLETWQDLEEMQAEAERGQAQELAEALSGFMILLKNVIAPAVIFKVLHNRYDLDLTDEQLEQIAAGQAVKPITKQFIEEQLDLESPELTPKLLAEINEKLTVEIRRGRQFIQTSMSSSATVAKQEQVRG